MGPFRSYHTLGILHGLGLLCIAGTFEALWIVEVTRVCRVIYLLCSSPSATKSLPDLPDAVSSFDSYTHAFAEGNTLRSGRNSTGWLRASLTIDGDNLSLANQVLRME